MKSIRGKITVSLIATVLIALALVGVISVFLNYRSTLATVEQMMEEIAVLAADRIEQELTSYKNVSLDTGHISQLSDPEVSVEEKRAIIDDRASLHGFQRGNIIGLDGISIFDGKDYSDREYYHHALAGEAFVSEPLVSKITGKLSVMVAAPIRSDSGDITGVVYFVPNEDFMDEIISSIHISPNSWAYMISSAGDTVAGTTIDTGKVQEANTVQNIEQEAQSNSSLKHLADIHEEMRQGKAGFDSFQTSDGSRFLAYAPVGGTNGWSVALTAPKMDYLADTYYSIVISVLVIVVSILASVVVAVKLSRSISDPMRACAGRMKQLVQGDLKSPVPQVKGRDETAELARSTAELVVCLNTIIPDIRYLLSEMANQNLDIRFAHQDAYVGGFQDILLSIRTLKEKLSNTMRQINASAEQVSSASNQVSVGAQTLSQGSMTQASSIEELAATVTDISDSSKRTSAAAEEAGRFVNQAGGQLGISVEHVKELNAAMEKISGSSEEISKIIATIENIAFQTNILALNAAVEAARAGAAGKGFAVVADEVRNLAAKATKDLIEGSIAAVSEGREAVGNVTQSLEATSVSASHVTAQMDIVVEAVEKQTAAIVQITEGIDQISSVVQTNSATAQESAAASEELSAEAASLEHLIAQFTLAKD